MLGWFGFDECGRIAGSSSGLERHARNASSDIFCTVAGYVIFSCSIVGFVGRPYPQVVACFIVQIPYCRFGISRCSTQFVIGAVNPNFVTHLEKLLNESLKTQPPSCANSPSFFCRTPLACSQKHHRTEISQHQNDGGVCYEQVQVHTCPEYLLCGYHRTPETPLMIKNQPRPPGISDGVVIHALEEISPAPPAPPPVDAVVEPTDSKISLTAPERLAESPPPSIAHRATSGPTRHCTTQRMPRLMNRQTPRQVTAAASYGADRTRHPPVQTWRPAPPQNQAVDNAQNQQAPNQHSGPAKTPAATPAPQAATARTTRPSHSAPRTPSTPRGQPDASPPRPAP